MKTNISIKKISILLAIFAFACAAAKAQVAGALDLTFGGGGKTTTNVGGYGAPNAIAVQPDGKIIVAGNDGTGWAAIRYNANGTLDTSFGNGGKLSPGVADTVYGIYVQTDGKIILAGDAQCGNNGCFVVSRFNSNGGALDTTFGGFGTGSSSFSFSASKSIQARTSISQPDGKIIVAGYITRTDDSTDSALIRYNSNGSVDTAFNSVGAALINFGGNDAITGVGLQPDGKIILVGNRDNREIFLARLNQNGTFDTTFGTVGRIVRNDNFVSTDAAVQPDGRIVVGGYESVNNSAGDKFVVERFNADGSLDATFGANGKTATIVGGGAIVNDVLLQPDGKIILTGQGGDAPQFIVLTRYNSNGTPDQNFGNSGIARASFGDNTFEAGARSIIQADGKILTAGNSVNFDTGNLDFALVRFLSAAQPARRPGYDFDGDGRTDIAVFRPSNGTWYRINSGNAAFSAAQFGAGEDRAAAADYDGDGKTDYAVWRPSNGTWYLLQSANGFSGVQFGQTGDIPAPADYDGDNRADIAVFRPSNGTWYILRSSAGFAAVPFGAGGDMPQPGDYDADGRADIAVFRPSNGTWYLLRSTAGFTGAQFGASGDLPNAADFDGDGRIDLAVFRPSNGVWYLSRSTAGFTGTQFGQAGDKPVAGDYDADGRADLAVFRASNGTWYLLRSTAGFAGTPFGGSGDAPAPAAFIP